MNHIFYVLWIFLQNIITLCGQVNFRVRKMEENQGIIMRPDGKINNYSDCFFCSAGKRGKERPFWF